MSRSLSYLCSGGVQTTSCCVTTSNTNLIRTAAQATPSSTCPAASGSWSSSWTWTTLAFTSAPWERNTSFLTTGSRWSEYQVSRAADGPGAKKKSCDLETCTRAWYHEKGQPKSPQTDVTFLLLFGDDICESAV